MVKALGADTNAPPPTTIVPSESAMESSRGDRMIGDCAGDEVGDARLFFGPAVPAADVQPPDRLQQRVDLIERPSEIVGDDSRGVEQGPALGRVALRTILRQTTHADSEANRSTTASAAP